MQCSVKECTKEGVMQAGSKVLCTEHVEEFFDWQKERSHLAPAEFDALHKKVVNAWLTSEDYKRLHPRNYKRFKAELGEVEQPTAEEFQQYHKEYTKKLIERKALKLKVIR